MKSATLEKTEVKTKKVSKEESFKQKASLFNFIIYTHEERRVSYFRDVVDAVIQKFPCRIIFIKGNTYEGEDEFKTEKSLKSAGPIACDHIEIHAGGSHLIQVPYYILPHLEPDLPIYLLWGQDPTSENEVLPRLVKYADRLIFDSECAGNLQAFSGKILENIKAFPCHVIDMNWARLAGWRHVIAAALDSPDRIEQLTASKDVQIIYNNRTNDAFKHPETQADYLQAWLATRLGWKYQSLDHDGNDTVIHYDDIQIRLTPRDVSEFTPGSIAGFISHTKDKHEFRIERQTDNPGQVLVNISSKEKCWLPFTLPLLTQSKGSSFIKELLYAHPSPHYLTMLETLSNENLS